uniref:Antimicrobial non-disulfide-bridged peptide n=1 Tax=Didymocentrus krausi TaxID=1546215 RepID=A0A3S8V4V1_9SCOR|nr:antimicrobial non-disulfide-bridged peptide [Didymocentrus krausi]
MQIKTFLVIFLAYLIMVHEAEAFLGLLGSVLGSVLPSIFKGKRKREVERFFEPYQKDLDMELERLLSQLE